MAAIVLGGVHAGVGKTTLAHGIAAALRAQGYQVTSYSVGPGLPQQAPEPGTLSKLPQQPVGLDGWLLSPDAARAAFHSLSAGADVSIIEGCLGMFDSPSADGSEQGSTAQLTQWLQVPVVLVIDTQAFNTVRGAVALIKGYTAVDGGLSVAGVILNKVTKKGLLSEVQEGLKQAALDVPVLGGVPKLDGSCCSSKQPPCPWSPASTTCSSSGSGSACPVGCSPQQLAQLVTEHISLPQLVAVAAKAAVPRPQVPLPPAVRTFRVSMGVAYDEAFFQYFPQNLHMLMAAGVQLVPFSPLHDSQLPPGLSAVVLGSGPVAEWGEQLSANKAMLEALQAFAGAGGLVMCEGAGLMYCSQSLQQQGQQRHAMAGLFPFHTQALPGASATPLAYVTVHVSQQSPHPLLLPGSQLRGLASCCCHVLEERLVGGLSAALDAKGPASSSSTTDGSLVSTRAASPPAGLGVTGLAPTAYSYSYSCAPLSQPSLAAVDEGYTCGTALGSCVQVHYGSCPEMVQHIAQRCLRVDVASVTAAASAAASCAATRAAEAATAAAVAAAAAAAMSAEAPHSLVSPRAEGGLQLQQQQLFGAAVALQQQQQQQAASVQGSRTLSAPDLQQVVWQQQCSSAADPAAAAGTSPAADSWMATYPASTAARLYSSPVSKQNSASTPNNMHQLGLQDQYQQQMMMAAAAGRASMSRTPSFNAVAQQLGLQQQGQQQQQPSQAWHPLHVPKRWSLELQRLGSQLLPGAKSPTSQQQQQQQQQQQHGRGNPHSQHSRNSSYGMVHLPEEAPLSDAAIKVLDSSLPTLLGRAHHTHIGLAVPLSSSAGGQHAAAGAGAASGPDAQPQQQRGETGSMSKSSSIHEQMSQLAASLAQQEGLGGGRASAGPSVCYDVASTVGTEGELGNGFMACEPHQHQQLMGKAPAFPAGCSSSVDGLAAGEPYHQLQQQLKQHHQQRLSLDQHSIMYAQQLQHHQHQQVLAAAAAAGAAPGGSNAVGPRQSLDSLMYPPAGLARIQQQLLMPDEGGALPQELSFKGMLAQSLQQQHRAAYGSNENLLAAADNISKSSSSSKLNAPLAAAGSIGGIISLSPAATDCLRALGLAGRLAGVTDACNVGQPGGSSCRLAPLLDSIGAPWAADAAEDAASCCKGLGAAAAASVPVVCRLVEGPDGLPRYRLDEDYIRRAQPSLVVVACEENSHDEPHLQHYQQLQAGSRSSSNSGGAPAAGPSGRSLLSSTAQQGGGAGQAAATSTMNSAVAVPGRVRLEVGVVQRVLQRAGVLWPEQRAVVLYQRCHSLAEVLEFMLVLASAAGVPERGVQLVAGLRARLRAAAARLCMASEGLSRRASGCSSSSNDSSLDTAMAAAVRHRAPLVMVLESVTPLRLAGFWVPELLELAGGSVSPISPAAAEPPAAVTWSQLRSAAPGVLVLALPGLDAAEAALHTADLAALPGFWSLPAVRGGAVYVCDHMLLARPGPALVLGVELLGHLVAPERQQLPAGLPMGCVLKLGLHGGQRCRPRLVPNYMSRYC